MTVGVYPNVPQGVAWNGNNIGGSLKRAVGIAMHVGFVRILNPASFPYWSKRVLIIYRNRATSEVRCRGSCFVKLTPHGTYLGIWR